MARTAQRRRKNSTTKTNNSQNTTGNVALPTGGMVGKARTKGANGSLDVGAKVSRSDDRYNANDQYPSKIRSRTSINTMIKELIQREGLFSSAANAAVTLAANDGFKVAGYNAEGEMDIGVMSAAYTLLDRIDMLHDYTQGYNDKMSMREIYMTMIMNVVDSGGCACELVLDTDFAPTQIVPIDYATIEWNVRDENGGRYPSQKENDNDLDTPTVFISEHIKSPSSPYAMSMLRPGIEMTFFHNEFIEDMRRSIKQAGNPRVLAKLVTENVSKACPAKFKDDPKKQAEWMNSKLEEVRAMLASLEPEDAMVFWDSVEISKQEADSEKADYTVLLKTLSNMVGVALKTPASGIGLRVEGGQGLSNAETLVYMRTVSAIPYTVCSALSRALTLAIRLLGVEGSVKLVPNDVELQPKAALEAYTATRQNRILSMLSLGLINDATACFELGLRPSQLVALAGTRFMDKNSETSELDPERVSSVGRAVNPGTPAKSGGEDQ